MIEEAPLRVDGSVDADTATHWYYEPGGFRPLAKATQRGDLLFLINDHLGTPQEMTTDSGEVVWSQTMSTWGVIRNNTLKQHCPLTFPGQYEDTETGLFYNRFRYYDPAVTQYTSPDPIRIAGGLNIQAYVVHPTSWSDPLGLAWNGISGIGPYGITGGHHIHAQSAFNGPGSNYNPNTALSISQNYMKCKGWNHQKMTNKQRELENQLARSGLPNTMAAQDTIAGQALMAGGANPAEAAVLVGASHAELSAQGVTPTKIPWN